ncbi:MAG: hypothetical protein MZU91_00130 [Desulfosudis oleivorans]|nr:hypothetical protein [Desulfosudis oleivorans]
MGIDSALTISILAEEFARGDASFFCSVAGGWWGMRPAIFAENKAACSMNSPSGFWGRSLRRLFCHDRARAAAISRIWTCTVWASRHGQGSMAMNG